MSDPVGEALRALAPDNPLSKIVRTGTRPQGVQSDLKVDQAHGALQIVNHITGPGVADADWLALQIDTSDLVLHTMHGASFDNFTPPEAHSVKTRIINPRQVFPPENWPDWINNIDFGSTTGRSSEEDFPFFLLSDLDGEHGLWFGVGWSGSWHASLKKEPNHKLRIYGAGCHATLSSDDTLELPRVFIGAWTGDGWAAVKRFLVSIRPRPTPAFVIYNTWFNRNAEIDERLLLKDAKAAADVGCEVFTIDATWYGGEREDFSGPGLGTWQIDKEKFPRGLAHLSSEVQKLGMKFGLWFEPERAHPESAIRTEHPDWVRTVPGERFGLVDFGRPEVRNWAFGIMSTAVGEWNLDWLKWDFNMPPAAWWAGDDTAELGHVRGVYEVVDRLRGSHPDLHIEMCASGGNRVDLEMLSRSDSYWITDQTFITDILREFAGNLHRVLPAQYRYTSITRRWSSKVSSDAGVSQLEGWDDYEDEWFLTSMGGAFGIMEPLGEWPRKLKRRAARHVANFKKVRHLLDEQYTLFRDPGIPLTGWEAWEFASEDQAVLIAFRQRSRDKTRTFQGRHRWRVTLPESGAALKTKGF